MPHTTGVITVDPQGRSVVVDITGVKASESFYTAAGGDTTHSLPLTITTPTDFHCTEIGDYTVSATIGGIECFTGQAAVAHITEGSQARFTPAVSGSTAAENGGSSGVPLADPTLTVDTDTYDNPVTGSGKITTIVASSETAALAIAMEGDAFPRILLTTDGTDALYLGDGTFDPYAAGAGLLFNVDCIKVFGTSGAGGNALLANGDIKVGHSGSGVVLIAPDASEHRLLVANDGSLSTEPAT